MTRTQKKTTQFKLSLVALAYIGELKAEATHPVAVVVPDGPRRTYLWIGNEPTPQTGFCFATQRREATQTGRADPRGAWPREAWPREAEAKAMTTRTRRRVIPMMAGPTIADTVTWRWDGVRLYWEATLRDGTTLRALLRRRAGPRSAPPYWVAVVVKPNTVDQSTAWTKGPFDGASAAQDAALAQWRASQP